MPIELGVWRIDNGVQDVEFGSLDYEHRLEDILNARIDIASPNWMVIGRQVPTEFGKFVDLLAIDRDGKLVVLELKRNKTHRDIVGQALDYGDWVKDLSADAISDIFQAYRKKYRPTSTSESLDDAFKRAFLIEQMPDELNESHELVIVASSLDPSTERVVRYLREYHRVPINAIFFNVFKEDGREYLSRAWLTDPTTEPDEEGATNIKQEWNGEYYVSYNAGYGPGKRSWEDAIEFGFISGGGGPFYSRTMQLLEPEGRIWVNVPGKGYVGVGRVVDEAKRVDEFQVLDPHSGNRLMPISELNGKLKNPIRFDPNRPEAAEYLARIDWIKWVPLSDAIKEKGFFGNQNTVAKPRVQKWRSTVERLKTRFGIPD